MTLWRALVLTKGYQGGNCEAANSEEGRQALKPSPISSYWKAIHDGRHPPSSVQREAYAPSLHSYEQAVRKLSRESHRAIEDVQFIPWEEHEGYGLHRVSVCPPGFRWKCSYYLGGLRG